MSIRNDPFVTQPPGSAPPQRAGAPPPPQPTQQTGSPMPGQQTGWPPPTQQATPNTSQPGSAQVGRDPFLTRNRPPQLGPESLPTASDPFLLRSHPAGPATATVYDDPFLTHQRPAERMNAELLSRNPFLLGSAARMAAWEVTGGGKRGFGAVLGPGDSKREPIAGVIYTLVPWFFFVWVLLLCMIQFHYLQAFTVFFVVALFLMCMALTLNAFARPATSVVALRTLGLLCCAAIVFGALAGHRGWVAYARQFWWLQTGANYAGVRADMPASMFADAAWIRFAEDPMATTNSSIATNSSSGTLPSNGTVDHQRSVGFIDGSDTYCVAPILNEAVDSAGLIPVHYWVVGLSCCDSMGNFECDDSREASAEVGVVLVDQVTGRHGDKLKQAIMKAEVAFNLRGSASALWMRWVKDPGAVSRWYWWRMFFYMTVAAFASFCVCAVLGLVCNYFGTGRYEETPAAGADVRKGREV